jgi:integrase
MRNEREKDGSKRFSVKTLNEYFKTFTKVVRSAVDDNGNQVHPRTWNLAFIGLPTVDKKKQHRPTLTGEEMTQLVANTAGRYQMGAALLAGSSVRISELLALRIEKHISNDRKTLYIRQQRKKDGSGVTDVLKTPAACRDIDLHSSIAKMLDDFIGGRNSGFLIQTENGTLLCCLRRTSSGVASSPYSRKWGEQACASMHSVASVKRCCKKARLGNSSSITGWAMRTTT